MPPFPSVCRDGECPQLRPRSVHRCPGIDILQAGSVQVQFSSQVTRPAFSFDHSTYTRRQVPALRALQVRVATWVLLIGEEMVAPDGNHFEPPAGTAGKFVTFRSRPRFCLSYHDFRV